MIEIFIIALGLSMDSFAVAVTSGVTAKTKTSDKLKMASFFGFFQGAMPILGFIVGLSLKDLIKGVDHWVAFGLLGAIGVKMIYESFSKSEKLSKDFFKTKILFVLALTTSIDALVIGVGFAFLEKPIFLSSLIIGLITLIVSFIGIYVGEKYSKAVGKNSEIIGGIVLILIGLKILLEHLYVK